MPAPAAAVLVLAATLSTISLGCSRLLKGCRGDEWPTARASRGPLALKGRRPDHPLRDCRISKGFLTSEFIT